MKTSENGKDLIKEFEGLRLKAYKDVGGVLTIGYGTTANVLEGMEITKEQASILFERDLLRFENFVEKSVKVPVNQNQFDALVSLCYNIGTKNLKDSTVMRELNKGNYDKAADAFLMWNKAKVKGVLQVVNGLTKRRQTERNLFLEAVND